MDTPSHTNRIQHHIKDAPSHIHLIMRHSTYVAYTHHIAYVSLSTYTMSYTSFRCVASKERQHKTNTPRGDLQSCFGLKRYVRIRIRILTHFPLKIGSFKSELGASNPTFYYKIAFWAFKFAFFARRRPTMVGGAGPRYTRYLHTHEYVSEYE